jgi:hypothetical protein
VPAILTVHGGSLLASNEGLIIAFVKVETQALGEEEMVVAGVEVMVRISVDVGVSTLDEELGFSELAEVETDVELELEGVAVLMALGTQDVTSAPICLGTSEMLGTKPDGQAKIDELVVGTTVDDAELDCDVLEDDVELDCDVLEDDTELDCDVLEDDAELD